MTSSVFITSAPLKSQRPKCSGSARLPLSGQVLSRELATGLPVTDPLIVRAMRRLFEVMKIVVEPSGAVPYAALLDERPALRGRRIGLIVSGGNLDLERLPWTVAP